MQLNEFTLIRSVRLKEFTLIRSIGLKEFTFLVGLSTYKFYICRVNRIKKKIWQ